MRQFHKNEEWIINALYAFTRFRCMHLAQCSYLHKFYVYKWLMHYTQECFVENVCIECDNYVQIFFYKCTHCMHSHILHLCSWTWQLDAAIYTTLSGLRTMFALNTAVYARMLLGFANNFHTECSHFIWTFY